jgi:teichuronic acid biosynthesis glycosyltransferase TuaG
MVIRMVAVSVIMPSYDHASYLPEAIVSVLNQSFEDFELIIVDDCSKDDSQSIIESYQRMDKRIRTVFHKENEGIAKTLNDGMNKAQGKFIAFIASDDVWSVSKLEKQLLELKKNEDTIVWSEGEIIDSKSRPMGDTFTRRHGASHSKKSGDILIELLSGNFIFASSLVFKRENARDIRFDCGLKYLNDYRFVVDLASKYPYRYMPEPLAKYRIHGRNTNLSDKKGWLHDNMIVKKYFLREYGNRISKRMKYNMLHMIAEYNILYMIAALTDEDSLIGRFLLTYYYAVDSLMAGVGKKLRSHERYP